MIQRLKKVVWARLEFIIWISIYIYIGWVCETWGLRRRRVIVKQVCQMDQRSHICITLACSNLLFLSVSISSFLKKNPLINTWMTISWKNLWTYQRALLQMIRTLISAHEASISDSRGDSCVTLPAVWAAAPVGLSPSSAEPLHPVSFSFSRRTAPGARCWRLSRWWLPVVPPVCVEGEK